MEECTRSAPFTSDQQSLAEQAIKYTGEAQESAKKTALDLKAKRDKRKRDKSSNSPAPKKARMKVPEDLRTAVLNVLAETQVTDDYTTINTMTYPNNNNTGHNQQHFPPPKPTTPKRKREGQRKQKRSGGKN